MTLTPCFGRLASLLLFLLVFVTSAEAQRGRSNVLYSDRPMPIRLGIEAGTTLTQWTNAEPTIFLTQYPYSDNADLTGPDTAHMRFGDGSFTPLFGTYFGIAADFGITNNWSILAKANYNERRGNWNRTYQNPFYDNVTHTSDLTLIVRYLTLEAFAKYSFESLGGLYLAGDIAVTFHLSNHYDIHERLGGPENVTFYDFGQQRPTVHKEYRVGYEFEDEMTSVLFEPKLLLGYPIPVAYRWSLHPEIAASIPINSAWTSETRDTYRTYSGENPPNPLTFYFILGLRYEL
jgi:hypothetical protein